MNMALKKPLGLVLLLALFCFAGCATARNCPQSQPLIVLLTDFGERDQYVGAMKGAIYQADPEARIDCITNEIGKFDIVEGAYTLAEAAEEFPPGTIFVGVVDPGVGSDRKGVAILTRNCKVFIGPDNGLLSLAANRQGVVEIRELSNRALMHPGAISNTFHGRDIFGPVAGHLAAGAPFSSVGPIVPVLITLPIPDAVRQGQSVSGAILHIDEYGNIITNIPVGMIEEMGVGRGEKMRITIGEREFIARFVQTYSDVPEGEYLFLNNKGFVETAINQRNLASTIGAIPEMHVTLTPLE
jgi:S-adenosylmethionine hydrolase